MDLFDFEFEFVLIGSLSARLLDELTDVVDTGLGDLLERLLGEIGLMRRDEHIRIAQQLVQVVVVDERRLGCVPVHIEHVVLVFIDLYIHNNALSILVTIDKGL